MNGEQFGLNAASQAAQGELFTTSIKYVERCMCRRACAQKQHLDALHNRLSSFSYNPGKRIPILLITHIMAISYAKDQTSNFKNHITNVAIVGAGGRSGTFITKALLKTGKHTVTAITRPDSSNKIPNGVHSINKADYEDHSQLVEALKGQEVLLITMSIFAPPESQFKLIDAAAEAGVKWIMPNEWLAFLPRR